MRTLIKPGGLLLVLAAIAGCATQPPAPGERVVLPPKQEQPAPPQRPLPPPVKAPTPVPERPTARPAVPQEAPPAMEQPAAPSAPAEPAQAAPNLPPAAKNLAARADQASAQGEHDAAAGYLERALRIAPRHPVLWQNLAVVRYRQRDYDNVEGLALKSNALAMGVPALRRTNWQLIATVRRLKGDARGAAAAETELQRLAE
jgi:tetratricopeptide (TPR) repeat protein